MRRHDPPGERRIVDPTPCRIRHVRRPLAGEAGVSVLRGSFVAAAGEELEALNDADTGWISATVTLALSDDGTATVRFANELGADGILHRERFGLLANPLYRIGEEWIEVYREPVSQGTLVAVFTPQRWKLNRGELELAGPDLMGLYGLARSSELDVWADAPRDVWEFYSRLPVTLLAGNFESWAFAAPAVGSGWASQGQVTPGATPGARLQNSGTDLGAFLYRNVDNPTADSADSWEASARIVWETAPVPAVVGPNFSGDSRVRLAVTTANGSSIMLTYDVVTGEATLEGGDLPAGALWRGQGKTRHTVPGGASLKILVRRRWVLGYVEGELIVRARRTTSSHPVDWMLSLASGTATVQRADVRSLLPFGLRGADKGDLRLPGIPSPGGLRGRYWNEAATASQLTASADAASQLRYGEAVLDLITDPSDSRLDATLDFAIANPPAWQPPAARPASSSFSARWTGAIYLDLATSDRRLKLVLNGRARVWIGRTLNPADAVLDYWPSFEDPSTTTTVNGGSLRAALGSAAGWYPIVVEYANAFAAGGISLQDVGVDAGLLPLAGQSFAAIPSSRLSPDGCYEQTHRLESHREILGAIAEGFGYQWRVEPRTLESGEFPGQVPPRIRAGVDTDLILSSDHGVDLASEGDAGDAVDRLLIDAQGIADPKGAAQLTADVVNDAALAEGHLFLSTGAESLADVSEAAALEKRADSWLALRSGPNEQIAARPASLEHALTDTFPLTGTLARRRWRPGDGLRLALEDLSVVDETPRQLVAFTQTHYRDGVTAPETGWRQRPRGLRSFLRRVARAAYTAQRSYQGSLAIVPGSFAASWGPDQTTRLPLPRNLEDVIGVELVVAAIAGTGTIIVNGTSTGILVTAAGRYPLDRYLGREGATGQRLIAGVTGATSFEASLEATVRI